MVFPPPSLPLQNMADDRHGFKAVAYLGVGVIHPHPQHPSRGYFQEHKQGADVFLLFREMASYSTSLQERWMEYSYTLLKWTRAPPPPLDPTSIPTPTPATDISTDLTYTVDSQHYQGGRVCPPLRRSLKEDLLRAKFPPCRITPISQGATQRVRLPRGVLGPPSGRARGIRGATEVEPKRSPDTPARLGGDPEHPATDVSLPLCLELVLPEESGAAPRRRGSRKRKNPDANNGQAEHTRS